MNCLLKVFDAICIFVASESGMGPRVILENIQFQLTLDRLCLELLENHQDFSNTALIGVQPRGVLFSDRLVKVLQQKAPGIKADYGKLDITFYRDDFRRREKPLTPASTDIPFSVEAKKVVLIDDVLYTGRTIRAAMDALLDYGRPTRVELLVLIDRRFTRHLPIQADYIGKTIDSIDEEIVKVEWDTLSRQDRVWILKTEETIQ